MLVEYESGVTHRHQFGFSRFLEFLKAPYSGHLLLQNKTLKTYLYKTESISECSQILWVTNSEETQH